VPADKPETKPVVALIDANVVDDIDHTPPAGVADIVADSPTQRLLLPVGVVGLGLIVMIAVRMQPVPRVYVMVEVPALTPRAIPEPLPIVATAVLLLLHVPPPDGLISVVLTPSQTLSVPMMVAGSVLTVKVAVLRQPVGSV
jgi:hypothetical protein